MPNTIVGYILPKRITPVLLLVEKSCNEKTSKKIYDFTKLIIDTARKNQELSYDTDVKMALYTFNSEDNYVPEKLVYPYNMNLEMLKYTHSDNKKYDLDSLFPKLDKDMSRKVLFTDNAGYRAPIIILIVDGEREYPHFDFENINSQNKWYRNSKKIAISISELCENTKDILTRFTNSPKMVINILEEKNAEELICDILFHPICTLGLIRSYPEQSRDNILTVDPINDDDSTDDWLSGDTVWSDDIWD